MNIEGKYVALDLETRDPGLMVRGPGWAFAPEGKADTSANTHGYPVGYALSWFPGDIEALSEEELKDPRIRAQFKSVYLGVRHGTDWSEGGNIPEDQVRSIVGPVLADPRRVIVAANILYDYGWTKWDGFDWKSGVDDVQIQAPLLDDNRRSSRLDLLAQELLGVRKNEEEMERRAFLMGIPKKNVKDRLWELPSDAVSVYAEDDACHALRIYMIQKKRMEALGLEKVWDMERRLIPILHEMRKHGVRVDLDRAQELKKQFWTKECEFSDRLEGIVGKKVDPWEKATQIELLREEGVENFPTTEKKGDDSLDQGFLKDLSMNENKAGEIAACILGMRRYQRARKTFIEEMILGHHHNGRIHCELHALRSDDGGTVSGRFSSSKPNLQQVPARDPELGPLIRGCFLPEEGQVWCAIDYSSQEPRLAVHFGEAANIRGAFELGEVYRADPRADAYEPTARVCGIVRKEAKIIRLGILYGMGGGKLAWSLGLPFTEKKWVDRSTGEVRSSRKAGPEAEALLEKFDENSPMDRKLAELAQAAAKQRGFVKTIMGRRATFPRRANGSIWFTHKALNRIIQGSAADMMKMAMINLGEYQPTSPLGSHWRMLLTVHDELGFSVDPAHVKEVTSQLAEIMSNAIPLTVPVVCDVEVGDTWGASMGNKLED